MDGERRKEMQLHLVVPKIDGPAAIFRLANPLHSCSIFVEVNDAVLKLKIDDPTEPLEIDLSMDTDESTSNIRLTVDAPKEVAILTTGTVGLVHWKSTNVYSMISEARNGPTGHSGQNTVTSSVFGDTSVCYKGYISSATCFPLSIDFKRDFIITEQIGSGAYGTVFKCHRGDAQFAVKKMRKPSSTILCPEVAAMIKLSGSDNVVQMYSSWSESEVFGLNFVYIAMELYERNLEDYFEARQELELPKIKQMFKQMMLGVKGIHDAGVIHRDLKPMNILLDTNDNIGIADFGMAKMFDPASTVTLSSSPMYGTQYYSDPALNSGGYDEKVDIYSCGIIYLEMHCMTQRRKCIRDFCAKYKHRMKNRKYDIWSSSIWNNWGGDKGIMKLMVTTLNRPDSEYILQKLQGIAETTEAKVALE